MCRGNYQSMWVAEGGYDFVAEALFNDLEVDGFFLEYDDERSGGFEPLRFVPKGKQVVLGLVTTKQRRARGQGHAQAPDRGGVEVRRHRPALHLPQCGFSSTVEGNNLTRDEETAKLRLMVETAAGGLGLGRARAYRRCSTLRGSALPRIGLGRLHPAVTDADSGVSAGPSARRYCRCRRPFGAPNAIA